ncbi:MAG: TRAP transporter small permease subunit [Hyphomicrobiales bacterium]|nr:TRAP transporter small permease subunit [Hyphomicrobiales bacterium]
MTPVLVRIARWFDQHFEPLVMIVAYAGFASIIAVEVVRRFLFGEQTTWGAEISIHLFVWLTWFGASWGVRNGTHLSFPGIRQTLPRSAQLVLLLLDNFLWLALGAVVLFGAQKMIAMQFAFESVIQGSAIPMWWSFSLVPIAWALIYVRAIQNCIKLVRMYRAGMSLATPNTLRTS